jgi:hypothetical protein
MDAGASVEDYGKRMIIMGAVFFFQLEIMTGDIRQGRGQGKSVHKNSITGEEGEVKKG